MHVAVCTLLENEGYFEFEGRDQDGWPHWKNIKHVPKLSLEEQEKFLQMHVVEYFDKEVFV